MSSQNGQAFFTFFLIFRDSCFISKKNAVYLEEILSVQEGGFCEHDYHKQLVGNYGELGMALAQGTLCSKAFPEITPNMPCEITIQNFQSDHFKLINDTYGHDIGDKVLQHLTTVTAAELRKIDVLGRLGGEEFAVLLPETGLEQAIVAAERLRITLEQTEVETAEKSVCFTVSIGVACMTTTMETIEDVLKSADEALYSAKKGGRNRVAVTPPADDCL